VHGIAAVQRSVLVRVVTDAGVEGWGNVDPTPGYSPVSADEIYVTVGRLAGVLAGTDAFNVHAALVRMEQAAAMSEARAAVEMALVDLKARALGIPVPLAPRGRVKDVVTLNAWIGTVPPEQAAREALAWHARGFRTAKLKVSGADRGGHRACRRGPRGRRRPDGAPVDFNESLRLDEAAAFIRLAGALALTLVEQPIARSDIAGLARIRAAIGIPLMADESVTDPARWWRSSAGGGRPREAEGDEAGGLLARWRWSPAPPQPGSASCWPWVRPHAVHAGRVRPWRP
jgi:muconate cycloisomerase